MPEHPPGRHVTFMKQFTARALEGAKEGAKEEAKKEFVAKNHDTDIIECWTDTNHETDTNIGETEFYWIGDGLVQEASLGVRSLLEGDEDEAEEEDEA